MVKLPNSPRGRYFLQRDAELAGRVLRVFLRAVEAKLRAALTARAKQTVERVMAIAPVSEKDAPAPAAARARSADVRMWAALLVRISEVFPLVCPACKGEFRLIAFITKRSSIDQILTHIGEPSLSPTIVAARAPPESHGDFEFPASNIDAEPLPENVRGRCIRPQPSTAPLPADPTTSRLLPSQETAGIPAKSTRGAVSFELASTVFDDPKLVLAEDFEYSAVEHRYFAFGDVGDGIVTVRFTI